MVVSITVELPDGEIALLKQLTHLENDADAVIAAARAFLRVSRLRELKGVCGKVEFDETWLENLELTKQNFPDDG
jgi:hypothetical protein